MQLYIKVEQKATSPHCSFQNHGKHPVGEMAEKSELLMKNLYYDPSHPGSFGGVEVLHRALQDETGVKVKVEKVKDFFYLNSMLIPCISLPGHIFRETEFLCHNL